MINLELLRERIITGERYLQVLDCVLGGGWQAVLIKYKTGIANIAESLALIHPSNFNGDPMLIYGSRQFVQDPAYRFQVCQCELYWQVKCQYSKGRQLYADHVFPYSLGGPTVPENRMMLCGVHNLMKSNDIHLFPWERGLPVWFPSVLSRIESRRGLLGEP
jgi:hypothetical protein